MVQQVEIAVIGAGVIGLSCALRLAEAGHEVLLIDPNAAGSGASYGNAGTIADYAVMPVGTPAVLRDLPRLLLDKTSPLAIRRSGIAALMPWLLRFAWQSLPAQAARNAASIAALVADAGALWQDMAQAVGAGDGLRHKGAVYVYDSAKGFSGAQADMVQRRALGIAVEMLDAGQLAALEPNLPAAAGGAFFPNAVFLSDPGAMMQALAVAVARAGVALHRDAIARLDGSARGIHLTDGAGAQILAQKVVLAAGAHSRALARMAGDRVPLDTERGYHLEWDMQRPLLSRPSCAVLRGFYMCPMTGRLRVVGTVELGGLTAPMSPHRLEMLAQGAKAIFPQLGPPDRQWMGFRPSMPDSVPVIGAGRDGRVFHAFGHGHIGVTLAPMTAQAIADAVAGRDAGARITACSPLRF